MKVFDVLGDGEIVTAETLASLLGMERLLASEFSQRKFPLFRMTQPCVCYLVLGHR